jgi:hypothetical protein
MRSYQKQVNMILEVISVERRAIVAQSERRSRVDGANRHY